MATVRDLITGVLREIRVVGQDGQYDDSLAESCLQILQRMVSSLQADRLQLFTVNRTTHPLPASQQTRTIGAAGQIVADRPIWIDYVGIIPAGSTQETELHQFTRDEWFHVGLKTQTDLYPRAVLYEPTTAVLGTFTFWPIPTSAPTFVLAQAAALTTPAALETVLSYPPGYEEAWHYALSRRCHRPLTGRPAPQELIEDLREAMGLIKRNNDGGPPPARIEGGLLNGGGYDIRSNTHRYGG